MTVRICSLKTDVPQSIPPGGYHVVRFPYGRGESSDVHGMHQLQDPHGHEVRDWARDDRAGLIWPAAEGWGSLTAMIYWEGGGYTELRDQFVRDPFGLSTGADSTATEHRPPSPGAQFFHKAHELFVHPRTPLALLVAHNDSRARRITLAELKLAIHPAEGA